MLRNFFRAARTSPHPWDLDAELLRWAPDVPWRIRDAVEGTAIFGGTGSGKSSSSGRLIAESFLRAGFGGLVLTVKPDDAALWQTYCRRAGRSDDVVLFAPQTPWRFNFIEYERSRSGAGAGLTENILLLMKKLIAVADRQSEQGTPGSAGDPYWPQARDTLARNTLDLLAMAGEPLTVRNMRRAIMSAPSKHNPQSAEWMAESYCVHCLRQAHRNAGSGDSADAETVQEYWTDEFASLTPKTRDSVASTLTSMLDILGRGLLQRLFSSGPTNLTPEACFDGKIIIVDLPVKEFAEVGVIAQTLWKLAFQAAAERRHVNSTSRPLFLAMDEAQNFVSPHDLNFVTTARSARVATLMISQSVSNYYARLGGGEQAKAQADGILANLTTKVFHALSDSATATWAAETIGRTRTFNVNTSGTSQFGDPLYNLFVGQPEQLTAGASEVVEYEVLPSRFSRLRKGGPRNAFMSECILTQSGRRFAANAHRAWLAISINQIP